MADSMSSNPDDYASTPGYFSPDLTAEIAVSNMASALIRQHEQKGAQAAVDLGLKIQRHLDDMILDMQLLARHAAEDQKKVY